MQASGKHLFPKAPGFRIIMFLLAIAFLNGCAGASTAADPASPTSQSKQQLRLVNQSSILLHNLIVRFPNDQVSFGDLPGGTTSEYRNVPNGVYAYAAYTVEIEETKYDQPVIDWVGEVPMTGKAFTYILTVDPQKWNSTGQVINLIRVGQDR
jgi:hypothetical protein